MIKVEHPKEASQVGNDRKYADPRKELLSWVADTFVDLEAPI